MNEKIPSMVKEWLRLAEMDLESAGFLFNLHRTPVEIICYHCQQSGGNFPRLSVLSERRLPQMRTRNDTMKSLPLERRRKIETRATEL